MPLFLSRKTGKGGKKKRNQEFIREQKNRNAFLAFPFQEEKKQVKQEEYKNEGGGEILENHKNLDQKHSIISYQGYLVTGLSG